MPPKQQPKQQPKPQPKKKITFEENEIDPKLKEVFPMLGAKPEGTKNKIPIKKAKGGAVKENSDDSDNIESESSDSDGEMEEHFDDIDEEDALENDDEDEEDEKSNSDEGEKDEDGEEDGNVDDDECMYRFTGKKSAIGDDADDADGEEFYFEEDEKLIQNIYVPNDKRITRPTLTKYERVRVLGERAKQLSLNAKPMIKDVEKLDPKEIAKEELKRGVLPMIIIRPLPTGQKERWKVNELKIVN